MSVLPDSFSDDAPLEALDGRSGPSLPLSERESEVLVLIAEGLSNIDIARCLSISPNSVKAHIRSGYRKLGVATRAQAVRAVLDRNMVRRR